MNPTIPGIHHVTAITADAHTDDEAALLDLATRRGMKGLRDEAERLAAARRTEEVAMDRYRRVFDERHLRTWAGVMARTE